MVFQILLKSVPIDLFNVLSSTNDDKIIECKFEIYTIIILWVMLKTKIRFNENRCIVYLLLFFFLIFRNIQYLKQLLQSTN